MRKFFFIMTVLLALCLVIVACAGGNGDKDESDTGNIIGDAKRGEKLYNEIPVGKASAPGCITCHLVDEDVALVGPSHKGIGTAAEVRVPGQSAEDYLWESITDPDAQITEGYVAGVMYKNYGRDLTGQEIADLVTFLLAQK